MNDVGVEFLQAQGNILEDEMRPVEYDRQMGAHDLFTPFEYWGLTSRNVVIPVTPPVTPAAHGHFSISSCAEDQNNRSCNNCLGRHNCNH